MSVHGTGASLLDAATLGASRGAPPWLGSTGDIAYFNSLASQAQLNLSSQSSMTPFSASSGINLTSTSSRAPYMRCLLQ